ncbi:MAG: dTDP-4-dehydrorhamnose 3,5-epimerase [Saprospirales bacterium]|nr:MAG: dTDP-4-dehydrorhamnose 3,5-epimerase [Saprospirales bacterium]
MEVKKGKIEGLFTIEPKVFKDKRGYFYESFNQRLFEQHIGKVHWVQDNEAGSIKRVFRGFHYQVPPHAQAKLVRVTQGEVLDIAIDIRPGSPTYGQSESVILSASNQLQFFIPAGFAHGYLVLSDYAVFNYKCDNYYAPGHEGGILFSDPSFEIDWPFKPTSFLVSEKDQNLPILGSHRKFELIN